jgi:hypothetical protein
MIMANTSFVASLLLALLTSATAIDVVDAVCECKKITPTDLAVCGVSAVAAVGTVPLAVAAVGFGPGGVLAGSLAAKFAAYFGMGPVFATFQSIGAAGLGYAGGTVTGGVGCSAVYAAYYATSECKC